LVWLPWREVCPASTTRIRTETITSAPARIDEFLEQGALSGYRGESYGQRRDYPVELCGLRVQVHRMVSSVAVLRSGASVSDGSRQNLAGFALGRIGETVPGWLCYCLEKRALGSDGGQRYCQGRDYPVELCGLCVQVHRVVSSLRSFFWCQSLRRLSPKSRRKFARRANPADSSQSCLSLLLEERALGGHGRQCERDQRHHPVEPFRIASEIHFYPRLSFFQCQSLRLLSPKSRRKSEPHL